LNGSRRRDFTCSTSESDPENGRPIADIEEGHISTASCILANLSMQTGKIFDLRPETEKQYWGCGGDGAVTKENIGSVGIRIEEQFKMLMLKFDVNWKHQTSTITNEAP